MSMELHFQVEQVLRGLEDSLQNKGKEHKTKKRKEGTWKDIAHISLRSGTLIFERFL